MRDGASLCSRLGRRRTSRPSYYLGVQMGGANAAAHDTEYQIVRGAAVLNGYTWDGNDTGLIGGLYAGVNLPSTSNIVYGIEGDINFANVGDREFLKYNNVTDPTYIDEWKSSFQGSLRARAGITAGDALLYVTGGLAVGQNTFDIYAYNSPTVHDSFAKTMVGWTAGAGVDYAVSEDWTARIEYRYTDFGQVTLVANVLGYSGGYEDRFDVVQQSVMLGISRKF